MIVFSIMIWVIGFMFVCGLKSDDDLTNEEQVKLLIFWPYALGTMIK